MIVPLVYRLCRLCYRPSALRRLSPLRSLRYRSLKTAAVFLYWIYLQENQSAARIIFAGLNSRRDDS
jgi:hypothetical protein